MAQNVGDIEYTIKADTAELLTAGKDVNRITSKMEGDLSRADRATDRLSTGLNKVGVAIAAAFTIDMAKRLISIGDEMNTLQARVTRLSPSVESAKSSMEALSVIASETGSGLGETQRLWESLTTSLKETGATNNQILQLTSTLQKIGTIGGSSSEEMANALRQFGQSLSRGTIQAEEFNSIIEQMPELARQIAAGLGISLGQLRQRMLEGKLTAQDALNAIQKQSKNVNEEFSKMPVSIDRAKNSLDVAFKNAISDLNNAIGLTSTLAGLMQSVADNLNFYNNNAGNAARMPKLIKLQQELNSELKDGQRWYETDSVFQARRAQAAVQLKQVEGEIAHIRAKAASDAKKGGEFNAPDTTGDDKATQKLLQNAQRRLTLSKLDGEARARQMALYDAEDAGWKNNDPRIKQLQDQYALTERNTAALKKNNQESKTSATQSEAIANKLENLKQEAELVADSTQTLTREQQLLRAEQSLGSKATDEQRSKARQYKQAALDAADATKGFAVAIQELPEDAENRSYDDSVTAIKAAFKAQLISKKQYDQASERLEADHQIRLAKIRAQQVVTPQQSALGEIDPVQQLANQHAQELALIQQFETQKGQITQRGLELMNAANTEYEQARIAAQWEIYRNQSTTNQLMADAIDSLQGGATNAITGLLNGTQSLQESFANIGTTILNSVVGSLVQMGIEWVKSQLMGQAAAAASLASTMAQATAAASAWAPAAMSASIATMGSAAAVGQTAYAGSLLAAKGMAVAGARYNGGSVDAGSLYRVGEKGKPEIFQASNGSQYMIPGDNGRVISNKDMQGGGSGTSVVQNVSFTINTTGGIDDATKAWIFKSMKQVALSQINDQANRPNGMIQPRNKR
ncbi:tape measure protein [Enterobacter kobei]|uniref:tape measure protein n=1 Tax=Enterobacter kobei TaxID=208224 RepID=UPI000EF23586|nr:tape measure protein [Enterobacter kobei]AYL05386.1 phage tail tape measure protein [Enterobacter kobei]